MSGPLHYSIDTSALVDWWVRYYPPKAFKSLVPRMEGLIAQGRLRASREVRDELSSQSDALHDWVKAQTELCVDTSADIQAVVKTLMATYHNHQKPDKGINGADPFVIALAATRTPQWAVVSGEKDGSQENPKIRWVCKQWRPAPIRHLTFLDLIFAEGWEL